MTLPRPLCPQRGRSSVLVVAVGKAVPLSRYQSSRGHALSLSLDLFPINCDVDGLIYYQFSSSNKVTKEISRSRFPGSTSKYMVKHASQWRNYVPNRKMYAMLRTVTIVEDLERNMYIALIAAESHWTQATVTASAGPGETPSFLPLHVVPTADISPHTRSHPPNLTHLVFGLCESFFLHQEFSQCRATFTRPRIFRHRDSA